MSGTPHKHVEFIKAWADGAEIQYRVAGLEGEWCTTTWPEWCLTNEYRIKPAPPAPHKWQEVIDAQAAGKGVQFRPYSNPDYGWIGPAKSQYKWSDFDLDNLEWRIKPEVVRYRTALLKDVDYYTTTADKRLGAGMIEDFDTFVRWIDSDWQEVEV